MARFPRERGKRAIPRSPFAIYVSRNNFWNKLFYSQGKWSNLSFQPAILEEKACYRALYYYSPGIVKNTHPRQRGSFYTYIEWGGWEAARLPWEKEIGEIPQDGVRGSSALPHWKASSFPTTPDAQHGIRTLKHVEIESYTILPYTIIISLTIKS
ncbi:hypothetical protein DYE48_03310 [Halobacillus trueperi]|uniref:Uncharacterized protein n=1 Tax=Halobacillus trueperi TaxID=156205 RepID=A0A3E0JC46_9BACI|nr:hypothetical protein DYE48_03310 [Halobacillus trueperi]